MPKTYLELSEIMKNNKNRILAMFEEAHQLSITAKAPSQDCSIVAINRRDGDLVKLTLEEGQKRDDLYILAAYPHIDPLTAVIFYEDERAQVLVRWCQDHGWLAPEQGEDELDPPYWHRLATWFNENTEFDADQILTGLVQEQLEADFCPETEYSDALAELEDLAQGIIRQPAADDGI